MINFIIFETWCSRTGKHPGEGWQGQAERSGRGWGPRSRSSFPLQQTGFRKQEASPVPGRFELVQWNCVQPIDGAIFMHDGFISKVVIYQHQWKPNWSYKCSFFKMCQNRWFCFIAYSNFLLLCLSLHGSWLAVRLLRNMPGQPVVTEVVNVGSKGGSSVVSVFM